MMEHPSHFRTWFAVILLVALVARLAAGAVWQRSLPPNTMFAFADSESYWIHGQRIARGEPYQFGSEATRIFRTPGYPVTLAALFWLVGADDPPVAWARWLGAVLGTLAVAVVMILAWQLFSPTAGLIAGLLAALYPGAIATSVMVLAEAPFCPLMLLQLFCWTRAWRAHRTDSLVMWGLIGGVAAACATLARPSWLLFTPMAAALSLLYGRWRCLQVGGCMLLGLVAGMGPWWIRNYQITEKFVPTTLQVGASLYDGLNPQADGASNMWFVEQFHKEQTLADVDATSPPISTFEYRVDRRLRDASIAWARSNPERVLHLAGIKFLRMWNVIPNAADMQHGAMRLAVAAGYLPIIVLGLWGAAKYVTRGWPYLLCLLPAIYFTGLHVLFVSSIRYREPAMLPIIVLAAGILSQKLLSPVGRDPTDEATN